MNGEGVKKPFETVLDYTFLITIRRAQIHRSRRYPRNFKNVHALPLEKNIYPNDKIYAHKLLSNSTKLCPNLN